MESNVRVRFAPSPTGGLHLGGVRTALYNYLFAKKHNGKFIVRTEDTDQTRFVEGAEAYIFDCLKWCGIEPDESAIHGGPFAPYRQSERKAIYGEYAHKLVKQDVAYYAFDTPEMLDEQRKSNPNFQYNAQFRLQLKNSLTLSAQEVENLLVQQVPYVVRIKMPADELVELDDLIRGHVQFNTNQVDDKVLLKADGMPTYHLAVVVDDYLMKISHAFRGEEWLPSAPVHILLWKYLFGLELMPKWAHLPLILKPDGHGKLSKRDGERLGFPVFAMNWVDSSGNISAGFKEQGFLPEAFINMLALLGWNDGTDKEIFNLQELIHAFSLDRVHKAGAKFDFEKAKWYNHEWIKQSNDQQLVTWLEPIFSQHNIHLSQHKQAKEIVRLVKDRCHLLTDFISHTQYFFQKPTQYDWEAIQPKWDNKKQQFFEAWILQLPSLQQANELETAFKQLATEHQLKVGEVMLPFRIMLVGGKFGPGVFDIAQILGQHETIERINYCINYLTTTVKA